MVIHLSLVDYICVSGSMDRTVLEYVDHLHEHFVYPVSINELGRYNVPRHSKEGYSIQVRPSLKSTAQRSDCGKVSIDSRRQYQSIRIP